MPRLASPRGGLLLARASGRAAPRPAWDGRADVIIIGGGSVWAVLGEHAPVLDQLDPHAVRLVPRSALIVAVPEVEPLVGDWRLRYDNASLGVPAHGDAALPVRTGSAARRRSPRAELEALFAAQAPICRPVLACRPFPGGRLARAGSAGALQAADRATVIVDRYPAYLPYEGAHDEVDPAPDGRGGRCGARTDEVEDALSPSLPIAAEVREVVLLEEGEDGQWQDFARASLSPS